MFLQLSLLSPPPRHSHKQLDAALVYWLIQLHDYVTYIILQTTYKPSERSKSILTSFKFMPSQRSVTDLRHWLSNKFFAVEENSAHRFFDTTPYDRFLNREHHHPPNGYVQVTGWNSLILPRMVC